MLIPREIRRTQRSHRDTVKQGGDVATYPDHGKATTTERNIEVEDEKVMATILIIGAGFGGVVAAESLAKQISNEHRVTLVSRSNNFVFYPDLVRVALGRCEPADISFDLRQTMLDHRVQFIQGEVARINPEERQVKIAHGEFAGKIHYDYLLLALGRRLATEGIKGFFEHANHLLDVVGALKLGERIKSFRGGVALIGQCPGARLPVPVYETAFALSRLIEERGLKEKTRITIVSPDSPRLQFGDLDMAVALRNALEEHSINYLPDFQIEQVTETSVVSTGGDRLDYNLLMLLPPFVGPSAVNGFGITNADGYINVDNSMRVKGLERVYAVGDCVNFGGPKLGHMAVHQAEVAANNLAREINGKEPDAVYDHEMMMVIDEGAGDTIYLHKGLWRDERASVRQGRFWSWAKRIHQRYWLALHS